MSGCPATPNKGSENSELYEHIEVVRPSQPKGNQYAETCFQSQPSNESSSPLAAACNVKPKGNYKVLLIALTTTLLLCLLVVVLVAVILYSPQVRTSSESTTSVSAQTSNMENLLSRIQRLEDQLEAKQITNQTQIALTSLQKQLKATLTSLHRQQDSFEATLSSQFQSVQNLVQSMSSIQSNSAFALTRLHEEFQSLNALDNQTAVEAKINQLSASMSKLVSRIQQLEDQFEAWQDNNQTQNALDLQEQQKLFKASLTSQFQNVQNLVQGMSLIQNNSAIALSKLREDFQSLNDNLTSLQAKINQLSSTASTDMSELVSRIEQLEDWFEAWQENNQTQDYLKFNLQEQQKSFEATLTSQFQNEQNLVQSMSLVQSNTMLALNQLRADFQENQLLTSFSNLSLQANVDQLSTLTNQLTSVHNLIQSVTSVQSNLGNDLNRLRSVNLFRNCITETRSCTMSTGGSSSYYWINCRTPSLNVDPNVSYFNYFLQLESIS